MATLKDLLNDNYREDMTVGELEGMLASNGIKLADLSKGDYVSKAKFEDTVSKSTLTLQQREQLITQFGTEKEQLEYQLGLVSGELSQLKVKANKQNAINILMNAGLNEEHYSAFIDGIVSEDEERTISLADNMAKSISGLIQTKQKEFENQAMQTLTVPNGKSGGSAQMTKDEFRSLTLPDKQKLANENPELYNSFTQQ